MKVRRRHLSRLGRIARRSLIVAMLLAALVLVIRLAATLALPVVIDRVARIYDLDCTYDRLDLSVLGGSAQIWNVRLVPTEGGEPILQTDFGQADISVLNLLRGDLVIYRVEADGVQLNIERTPDGRLPLLARLIPAGGVSAASPPPAYPRPLDFNPPLRVDALRLTHVQATFDDQFVSPPVQTRVELDVRMSDFGVPGRATRFEMDMSADPVLDSLTVQGTATDDGTSILADLNVLMRGLHPDAAEVYLAQAGLRPAARNISASMEGVLRISDAADPRQGAEARLELDKGLITCDGTPAAEMDHLTLEAPSLTASSAQVSLLSISGVRVGAQRGADGHLSALGIEYVPAPPTAQGGETTFSVSAPALPAFGVSLEQMDVNDVRATFSDQSVSPAVGLEMDVSNFSVVHAPGPGNAPIEFAAEMSAPGMAQEAQFAGQANPFAGDKTFSIKASADGITLGAIQPYLSEFGLTTEWKNGSFRMSADGTFGQSDDGRFTADALLRQFELTDATNLLSLSNARIAAGSFDPRTETIHADAIDISGPAISAQRDADGNLHALGFRFDVKSIGSTGNSGGGLGAALASAATKSNSRFLSLLPNLQIGGFDWKDIRLLFTDDAVSPPAELAVADAGVELKNFVCPAPADAATPVVGEMRAWLKAPNIAPDLELAGSIRSQPRSLGANFQVSGSGLCGGALAPYLQPFGISPVLNDGTIRAVGDIQIDNTADGLSFSTAARDMQMTDRGRAVLSMGAMRLDRLHATENKIGVDSIVIEKPFANVTRHEDGRVELGGLLFSSEAATTAHSFFDEIISIPSLPALGVGRLQINDAGMHWSDVAVSPSVQTDASVGLDLHDFELSPAARPAEVHVWSSAAGICDSIRADGTIAASLDDQALNLDVIASGVRAGPAAVYFPAGVKVSLKNGQFRTHVAAAMTQNPRGGKGLELSLRNLDYRDGAGGAELVALDSFHAKASRVDPDAKLIAVDDVSLSGFVTRLGISSSGVEVAGLKLTSPPPKAAPAAAASQAAASGPAPSNAPESSEELLRQVAAERNRLPLVLLNDLDLNCRAIQVAYEAPENPPPLLLSNLRLHNTAPLIWLGRDVESNPSTELELTGRLDSAGAANRPIAEAFHVDVHAMPFLRQKTLGLDFVVDGIHGRGVADAVPWLTHSIQPDGLTDGQISGSLNCSLRLANVRQTEFNLAYGGKLDVSLKDLQLRAAHGGPVMAGVSEIQTENVSIGPDLSSVDAPEISIENIAGQVTRQRDGIHFMNVVIPLPKNVQSHAVAAAGGGDPPAPASDPTPGRVVKVDRLLVSGMNFEMVDHTVDPPLVVPIDGLDLEALGISSAMFGDQTPVRFSVLVDAGKVNLSGATTRPAARQLFSQVTGNGVLSLSPHIKGWAKASVSGFELGSLSSLAKTYGVTLGGGTFDGDMDLRFAGDGSVDTSTRLVLTDLSLSEPPNGALSHALSLPAPLDVVIGVLEDQDGSITIPLNVAISQGQLNGASVAASASAAFLSVVAGAVASLPLKVADLAGLNSPQAQREPPIVLMFPPGYPGLDEEQTTLLQNLALRLQRDRSLEVTIRHDLGSDDIALAGERVNPSVSNALDLADAFSRRREELLSARRIAASDVRALLASTAAQQASVAIDRLRSIEQQLADIDNALDKIYDLSRPGADRQSVRRTRQACLEIASARLEAAQDILTNTGKKKVDPGRIHLSNAQFNQNPAAAEGDLAVTVVRTK